MPSCRLVAGHTIRFTGQCNSDGSVMLLVRIAWPSRRGVDRISRHAHGTKRHTWWRRGDVRTSSRDGS
jgi:hypothetical protein